MFVIESIYAISMQDICLGFFFDGGGFFLMEMGGEFALNIKKFF